MPFSLKVFVEWKTLEAEIHRREHRANLLVRAKRGWCQRITACQVVGSGPANLNILRNALVPG